MNFLIWATQCKEYRGFESSHSPDRKDRLYAVEEYGEGQQERELIDGVQHDSTGGEDESDLVAEAHDQHPKEEPSHQRGRG